MNRYSYVAISEKASHKKTNEDRVFINKTLLEGGSTNGQTNGAILAVVCDGVGGVSGGEIAANETAASFFSFDENSELSIPKLDRHILRINDSIKAMQKTDKRNSLMATTLAGLVIKREHYIVFNVGDSRVYLYSNKNLTQLTQDHTVAQEKASHGELLDIRYAFPADRNTLTRYIGGYGDASIPFTKCGMIRDVGTLFLLCSDGISKSLSDNRISSFLATGQELRCIAENIVAAAKYNGCLDDQSVVLIQAS